MTPLESLLAKARTLPVAEQIRLAEMLLEQATAETEMDERMSGHRGLASLTESTKDEDWSSFYPAELVNGRGS